MKSFLSYPSERLQTAWEVFNFLRSVGVVPWFDKESLVGGHHWERERATAQQAADVVLLISSQETFSRAGVIQREVRDILEMVRDRPLDHIYVIPLRVEEFKLPRDILQYQYIDVFRPGWQTALARSLVVRLGQLKEDVPRQLSDYLQDVERAGAVEFRALRDFRRNSLARQAEYFVYKGETQYWSYVSAEITADIVGGFYRMQQAERATRPLTGVSLFWSRRVQEHFRDGELVSLRFEVADYHGGAHGTQGVYTKNFGGPSMGKVELEDLFDRDKAAWEILRHESERACANRGAAWGIADYQAIRESDFVDRWHHFSQWTFNREGLQLHLGVYSGQPNAFGYQEVEVPWSLVRDKIAPEIRETPLGRFVG